jgi:pteridine reductase
VNSDSSKERARPVAWITGSGAPRVGRVIAEEFALAGYRIVLHANRSIEEAESFQRELASKGTEALIVSGAVQDESFARRSVELILSQFGQLDVCVNAAAVWDWKCFDEITAQDLQHQFEVNTLGSFLCSQAAGLAMVANPHGGSVILIGDWAVARPYPKFSSYFVGKGAIESMTRSLAVELALRNPSIRVNAILPGPVMLDPSISAEAADRIRDQSLLKRHGTPQDVARAARFLAEQPFITGVCLPVDGGRTIYSGEGLDAVAHPTFLMSQSEK